MADVCSAALIKCCCTLVRLFHSTIIYTEKISGEKMNWQFLIFLRSADNHNRIIKTMKTLNIFLITGKFIILSSNEFWEFLKE